MTCILCNLPSEEAFCNQCFRPDDSYSMLLLELAGSLKRQLREATAEVARVNSMAPVIITPHTRLESRITPDHKRDEAPKAQGSRSMPRASKEMRQWLIRRSREEIATIIDRELGRTPIK